MSERTIYLHIGHHRTATSYLQAFAFPGLSWLTYFHKQNAPASAAVVKAFLGSPEIWLHRGEQMFSALARDASGGSALISSEEMSAHRMFASPARARDDVRRDPYLLTLHLREARAAAERVGYRLKVVMGIRRQDQYFGSRYAKQGFLIDDPSQADFVRQVSEITDPDRRYFRDGIWLDYALTHRLVSETLGKDHLLVLPFEQLRIEPDDYFETLSNFLGGPVAPETQKPENARSIGPNQWKIEGRKSRRLFPKKRTIHITLDDDLKVRVLDAYADSNRCMSAALGIDLGRYGYH